MKKYILIWILTVFTCLAFADGKKELKFIVDDIDSKEFKKAEAQINKFQSQGDKYFSQGEYDKALKSYKKALAEAEKTYGKNSTATASIYTSMSVLYIKKGKKLKAADSVLKASEIYKYSAGGTLFPSNYYTLRLQASKMYCDLNKTDIALGILKELEEKIKIIPENRRAEVYCFLADCYHVKNKFAKAVKYCVMASKEISPKKNKDNFRAKNYDIWAVCLIGLGKRKEAIEKQQKCLEYAEKDGRFTSFIGQVVINLGTNYMELDNYSKAKKYFVKALRQFQKVKKDSLAWQGLAYLLLAHNARYHQKWQEANNYYEKSTALFEKILFSKNKRAMYSKKSMDMAFVGICKAYRWLPVCYFYLHKLGKIELLYPGLQKLKGINKNTVFLAEIYLSWAGYYIKIKDYKKASLLIVDGLEIYNSLPKNFEVKKSIAILWWLKAKILHITGNSQKAYKIGFAACKILEKAYSNNPEAVAMLKDMLKSMKNGTPFGK